MTRTYTQAQFDAQAKHVREKEAAKLDKQVGARDVQIAALTEKIDALEAFDSDATTARLEKEIAELEGLISDAAGETDQTEFRSVLQEIKCLDVAFASKMYSGQISRNENGELQITHNDGNVVPMTPAAVSALIPDYMIPGNSNGGSGSRSCTRKVDRVNDALQRARAELGRLKEQAKTRPSAEAIARYQAQKRVVAKLEENK